MADLANSISKVGSKAFADFSGNIDGQSGVGVKTFGTFSRPIGQRPDAAFKLVFQWYDEDKNDGLGVKTFATFGSNFDCQGGVGVKTFAAFHEAEIISDIESGVGVRTFGTFTAPGPQGAWVKWAKISTTDFTIDKTSRAGRMPLDWPGLVNNLCKLGSKIVAYGTNGVSILTPAGKMFGLNTIHKIGLIGRDAFAGTDFVHYFIDNKGRLYQLTSEGLKLLDYEEYLKDMLNPVLTLDEKEDLLYICDGTTGYIYSSDSQSLGSGPVNITGMGHQSEVRYTAASGTIITPTFKIWTDTYDLGTRKGKSIQSLEIGTDMTEKLWAAVRYRLDKSSAFTQTNWYSVDKRGQVFIPIYGHEFQFGFMSETYEYFEPDYLIINGEANAH